MQRGEKYLNWSLFDWLCILFEIKAIIKRGYGLKLILIAEIILKSKDAKEAESVLREISTQPFSVSHNDADDDGDVEPPGVNRLY